MLRDLCRQDDGQRAAYLEPLPMPGGAAAIKAPWRMAVSYLIQAFGEGFRDLDIDFMASVDPQQAHVLAAMIRQGLNAPLTSSMGRLSLASRDCARFSCRL